MPLFEIEQYKTHSRRYHVTAKGEAEALAKLFKGQGRLVEGSEVFIENNEDLGLASDDYPDIAESLRQRGYRLKEVIPSIRSITRIE